MKNTILSAAIMAFVLVSCNQKTKEVTTSTTDIAVTDSTTIVNDTVDNEMDTIKKNKVIVKETKRTATYKIYSCPMHPEVQGKLNSKCSKCGMPLTESVS